MSHGPILWCRRSGAARYFVTAVCLRFAVVVCAQSSRVPARLVVNDQDMGSVVALIEAEKIWLPLDRLRTMGFVADGAEVRVDRGTTFARLDTLRPGVEATLDADTITIRVTAGAAAFTGRTIDVARHRGDRRVPVVRAPSAFLNYSFTSDAGQGTTVAGELGVSAKNAHFTASAVQSPVSGLMPGPIRLVFDDSERLNRWVVGDDVVGLGGISSATPLVGVTFSRAFAIDPYFVPLPALQFSASTAVPATVEVYFNDQLVRREAVGAGPFTVAGLMPTVGHGVTRVVVRDALGRERTFGDTFYQPEAVLAEGLQAFSYGVGQRRDQVSGLPDGPWIATAAHRFGLTDRVTLGGRGDATADLVSGGPQVGLALPWGELEMSVAASRMRASGSTGAGGLVAYSYRSAGPSVGGFLRFRSRSFIDGSPYQPEIPERLEAGGFAGVGFGSRTSATVGYDVRRDWADQEQRRVSLTASVRLATRLSASVSVSEVRGGLAPGRQAYAGLTIVASRRTTAAVSGSNGDRSGTIAGASVQRALPVGEGLGYRLAWQDGSFSSVSGAFQAQSRYGRVDAISYDFGDARQASLGVSGALAFVGHAVHPTRTIDDAFALIRVPGQSNVKTYVDGQYVGRTNSRGELLAPNLLSYHENVVSIASEDVPFDTTLESVDQIVSPGLRGGATVSFAATRTRRIVGRLRRMLPSGATSPLSGDFVLENGAGSPLGRDGQFYFANLPQGRHRGEVRFGEVVYRCQFEVPALTATSVTLGEIICPVASEGGR
jgi:outer membrane usher protein